MYTETMTLEEMHKEWQRDNKSIQEKEFYFRTQSKECKAARRQGARYPFYVFKEMVVNGNKYLSMFVFSNRKAAFNNNLGGAQIALVYRGGKLHALLPLNISYSDFSNAHGVMLLSNHLFERYSERTGYKGTGIERIKHFIKEQGGFYGCKDYKHPDNENAVMFSCKEGAVFGEYDEYGNILAKTFIDVKSMEGGYKGRLDDGFNEKIDNDLVGMLIRSDKSQKKLAYTMDLIQKR